MNKRFFQLAALIIVSLQACVYRMDIHQGNHINQDKLNKLELGMTRSQVEFLLGEAAIRDLYHANQSHYIYHLYHGEEKSTEQKTMILTFDDDKLVDIDGSL